MKIKSKWIALALSVVLAVGSLAGCSNVSGSKETTKSQETNASTTTSGQETTAAETPEESTEGGYVVPEEPVTIRIYHLGTKPDGWDEVYAKYLEMTKDTLNIQLDMVWTAWGDYKQKHGLETSTGAEIDLCFDASWLNLGALAADGYYADLSEYFNNPDEYPGLAAAFSPEAMEYNGWYGSMNYIPLFESLGNAKAIYYRVDWAKKWGIGTNGVIDSWEEMEAYWQAALADGVIPIDTAATDGFSEFLDDRGKAHPGSVEAGLQVISAGGLNVWTYIKDNKLLAYAVEGAGDEAFKDFPEGWQYDFGAAMYDTYQEWQDAGYAGSDSMNSGASDAFDAGLSASTAWYITDYEKIKGYESGLGEGAEVGYFICLDAVREKQPGAVATNYDAGNGLCIPKSSAKIDYTMKFLDWMFGSKEAHDLFQYGIEGRDFEYGDVDGTIVKLTKYSSVFYSFTFTQNPNYAYFSTGLDAKTLDYVKYLADEDSLAVLPAASFKFDSSDVDLSTAVAQCKAVTDMTATVKKHGIAIDGEGNTYDTVSEMLKANVEKAMKNGGQEVVDAIVAQLKDYLAAR